MHNLHNTITRIFLTFGSLACLLLTPTLDEVHAQESLRDPLQTAATRVQTAVHCAIVLARTATGIGDYDLQSCHDRAPIEGASITLIPVELAGFGIVSVVPEGWELTSPGTYTSPEGVALLQQAIPNFTPTQFVEAVLEPFNIEKMPEPIETLSSDWADWQHYTFEVDNFGEMLAMQLAVVEVQSKTYAIMLAAPPEQIDTLYSTVFMPTVMALRSTSP